MPRPHVSDETDRRARQATSDGLQAENATFDRVVQDLLEQLQSDDSSFIHRNRVSDEEARQLAVQAVEEAGLVAGDDETGQTTSAASAFEHDRFPDRDDTPGR